MKFRHALLAVIVINAVILLSISFVQFLVQTLVSIAEVFS